MAETVKDKIIQYVAVTAVSVVFALLSFIYGGERMLTRVDDLETSLGAVQNEVIQLRTWRAEDVRSADRDRNAFISRLDTIDKKLDAIQDRVFLLKGTKGKD